jgi:hypothetical protein
MTDNDFTSLADGRDEMNLADFPISALTRTQKMVGEAKQDRMEFESSRFDPTTRQQPFAKKSF